MLAFLNQLEEEGLASEPEKGTFLEPSKDVTAYSPAQSEIYSPQSDLARRLVFIRNLLAAPESGSRNQRAFMIEGEFSSLRSAPRPKMELSDLKSLRMNGAAILTTVGSIYLLSNQGTRVPGAILAAMVGLPLVGGGLHLNSLEPLMS